MKKIYIKLIDSKLPNSLNKESHMNEEYISFNEYKENKRANEALEYLYDGKKEIKKWTPSYQSNGQLSELDAILRSIDVTNSATKSDNSFNVVNIKKYEIEEKVVVEQKAADTAESKIQNNSEIKFIYKFCHLDPIYIKYKKTFDDEPTEIVVKNLQKSSDKSIDNNEWANDRRLVRVACSIVLNERGIAPEFRDAKSGVTHKAKFSAEESQESNDRQIIDMHWLYLHHQQDIKPTPCMKDFFINRNFDFKLAEEFVTSAIYTKSKIQRLGIPKDIQKLLLILRSKEILNFQKAKREEIKNLKQALFNRSRNPNSRLNEDSLEQNILAFRCLLYAELSVVQAMGYWSTALPEITSRVTQQLKPWMISRLKLLKDVQRSEKGES